VFTKEKLDEIGDRLEYSRGKFLRPLVKETGASKTPARTTTKTPGAETI
jgi:hypothetical protein